jgi:hypothetical protein
MNTIIRDILNRDFDNIYKININRVLFVDNFFEGNCGCFDDEVDKEKHTYENMVKNTEYYIREMEVNNVIIKSFINNNINKIYINGNLEFESGIIIKDELRDENDIIINFSNVGFNQNKTEALIHMSISFPDGYGYAKYLYLVKEIETWEIKNYKYSWYGG